MSDNSKPLNYPVEYEITEVCTNFISRKDLNNFMQTQGIFGQNASAKDLAEIISHCVWEKKSIDELRNKAFRISKKSPLTGFVIKSNKPNFSLYDLYKKCRDNDRLILSKGYKLGSLISIVSDSGQRYKGSLNYSIRRPGRIQLLENEESYCEFVIYEIKEGEWQVEVDGNRSNDGKEVQSLFYQLTDKESTKIESLNISDLTDTQTIDFFDSLWQRGMPNEWNFSDIKALTIRQGRELEQEEEQDEEQEDIKNETLLTGIKQAILEGHNLRNNPFVKDFEKSGSIFTAMTFEFSHTDLPRVIQIRAEFKGNPKIFEVSIVNFFENTGTNATPEATAIDAEDSFRLRSIFWNNARTIFKEIKSSPSKGAAFKNNN